MWNKIKTAAFEWLKTLSSKPSFFSSKRLERFVFTGVTIGAIITCIVYEIIQDKLTATEVTILTAPLLLAAGYNLGKTEQAKKTDNADNQQS